MNTTNKIPMSVDGMRLKALVQYEEEIIKAEKLAKEFKPDKYEENIKSNAYKGALYSAASKNCKRKITICWLQNIVFDKKIDITTCLAREILKKSLNTSININRLNEFFGTPGRTGTDKTKDFKKINKIVVEIKSNNLDNEIKDTLQSVIKEMKSISRVIKASGGSETLYSRANEEEVEDDSVYAGL